MIDYSKAFDKVDITVAMNKLLGMHLRPEILPWICDFLSGRVQCVRHGTTLSDWSPTTCGVPQGTKVGPVVFLAMVNHVASSAPKRWKYVDDITVGESCSATSPAEECRLQGAMDNICEDASTDHMTLNVAKCATMQISFARTPPPPPEILANGETVPLVNSVTLLGVTISDSMKWDMHIENFTTKANSKRYFLVVLKRAGVTTNHLLKFYTTFVRPGVENAAPVWHSGLAARLSDKVEMVQRSSLRTIFPDKSYREALLATGLLTLHARRVELCLTFAKSVHGNPDFSHWFPAQRQDCHRHNLRNNHRISDPPCRTKRLKNSPVHHLISLINNN